jgi:hypothetical protein
MSTFADGWNQIAEEAYTRVDRSQYATAILMLFCYRAFQVVSMISARIHHFSHDKDVGSIVPSLLAAVEGWQCASLTAFFVRPTIDQATRAEWLRSELVKVLFVRQLLFDDADTMNFLRTKKTMCSNLYTHQCKDDIVRVVL